MSFRDTPNIYIRGGKFNELNFGYRIGDENFDELFISSSHSEAEGNIKIAGLTFNKIEIIGENFKEILFQNIKCNHFYIGNFFSSSPLKIYGLEPKNNSNSFFEIHKSNLSKAQIFRVDFEKFTEVIFIDSYFSDVNFIGTNWGQKNYRAIGSSAQTPQGTVDRTIHSLQEKKTIA